MKQALQPLGTGAIAPDFTLAAHTGEVVTLSAYRGRRVVLSFLPFAFTSG